jgi:hypothetical protein
VRRGQPVPAPVVRHVTLSADDCHELRWLRGSLYVLLGFVRTIDRLAGEQPALLDALDVDPAGLLYLVEEVEGVEALNRIVAQCEDADKAGAQ